MPIEKCPHCNGTGEMATVKKGLIGGAEIKKHGKEIHIAGGNTFYFGSIIVAFVVGCLIGFFSARL
jgi:hypothetical protein